MSVNPNPRSCWLPNAVRAEAFKRVVLVGLSDKDPNAREVGAAIAGAVKGLKGWVLPAEWHHVKSLLCLLHWTHVFAVAGGSVGLTRAEGVDPQAIGPSADQQLLCLLRCGAGSHGGLASGPPRWDLGRPLGVMHTEPSLKHHKVAEGGQAISRIKDSGEREGRLRRQGRETDLVETSDS